MAMEAASVEAKEIERLGFYALAVNVGLAALKGALAMLSGSLALAADAVDSLTDCVASLAVWLGLRFSHRRTRSFPYGLYKLENVVSVGVALLIFLAGYEILRSAFSARTSVPRITIPIVAGTLLGALVPWVMGRYFIRMGERTGSPSLVAEGRHRQVDVLSSLVVFAAVLAGYTGWHIDRIAAVVVVLFIFHTGWELLSDGMRVLLDASLDPDTILQIRRILESDPTVVEVKEVVGRNSGRVRFVEARVTLRVSELEKAHAVVDRLEQALRREIPRLERVLIHYEPMSREYFRHAVPLESLAGRISPHFGEAPYFAFFTVRLKDGQIAVEEMLANPFTEEPRAKGIRVAEWLVTRKVDVVWVKEDLHGKGPVYVFRDAGVDVRMTQAQSLDELLQEAARATRPAEGGAR